MEIVERHGMSRLTIARHCGRWVGIRLVGFLAMWIIGMVAPELPILFYHTSMLLIVIDKILNMLLQIRD